MVFSCLFLIVLATMAFNPGAALRQALWDDFANQVSIIIVVELHEMGEMACWETIGLELLDKPSASCTQLFVGTLQYFFIGGWLGGWIVLAHSIGLYDLFADLTDKVGIRIKWHA